MRSTPDCAASLLTLYWRASGAFLLTLLCLFFLTDTALAQGVVQAGQSFRCVGSTAQGQLFDLSPRCPELLNATGFDFKHIFSFFVCHTEKLITALFGNLYCGIIRALSPAVYAVATLAVMFFGIAFTTGILDFTARELLGFLMKIALFVAFTTEADYMIGIAFKLFVTTAQEGIAIAISGIYKDVPGQNYASGQDLYFFMDNFFYRLLTDLSQSIGAPAGFTGDANAEAHNPCKNAVFAALGLLAVAFPPIFYIGVLILAKIAMVFVRGVFGYMVALVGLAFLMVLSPIYLSFGLFRQTRRFFDRYIGYLASFTLQMLFVFTFLAFVLSLPLSHVSNSLLGLITYQKTTYEGNTWRWPWEYCSICQFDVYDINGTPNNISDDRGPLPPDTKVNSAIHRLQCKEPKQALEPLALFSPQPDGTGRPPVVAGQQLQNQLMNFAMYGLLGLLVLGLVVDKLLSMIPLFAQQLSNGLGARFAPQLGGGQRVLGSEQIVRLPFEDSLKSFADGFQSGYTQGVSLTNQRPDDVPRDGISALAAGLEQGSKAMVAGDGKNDPGMVGGMVRFLINPLHNTGEQGNQ